MEIGNVANALTNTLAPETPETGLRIDWNTIWDRESCKYLILYSLRSRSNRWQHPPWFRTWFCMKFFYSKFYPSPSKESSHYLNGPFAILINIIVRGSYFMLWSSVRLSYSSVVIQGVLYTSSSFKSSVVLNFRRKLTTWG